MNFEYPLPTTLSEQDLLLSFYGCIENSDDGFLVVDPEGNIAYINKAYCEYINIGQEDVLGKPVLDYIDTSRLPDAAKDPFYATEKGVLHKVSALQYRDREQYCIVNRSNISKDDHPISGVGQIKFVRSTLKLSSAISAVYDELSYYKEELQRLAAERYSFQSILGDSNEMRRVKELALRSAGNDFPVLITGETGTGKEVFASAIHYASGRKSKPFIRINCAAIPSELLESELFGFDDGSFTGARKGGKKGKFELANGGTLFLDEIGDMPLVMQAKMLRVLQEGEVEHVGGGNPIPIDVRIIAATNKNLEQEIKAKHFRSDLFFRLNVISITLPPLRTHSSDVNVLIDAFLSELNEKYHTEVYFSPEVRKKFQQYAWPGNVRELKNMTERCYATRSGSIITSVSLPMDIRGTFSVPEVTDDSHALDTVMSYLEREVLVAAIQHHHGNLRKTAESLGIHRVTLYKKMEKHGITRENIKGSEGMV